LVAVVVAIAVSVRSSRRSKLVKTYDSARWTEAADIRNASLDEPAGVFLGLHRGRYLRHEGPEHVLTFGPTRSGKDVGLVVHTLLSWPASAATQEIKVENCQITAGLRSRFSHCLLYKTNAKSLPLSSELDAGNRGRTPVNKYNAVLCGDRTYPGFHPQHCNPPRKHRLASQRCAVCI